MRLLSALLTLVLCAALSAGNAQRPNIVILLADDFGYGEVSCYAPETCKLKTPHIDALAASGMRFTDAHTSCAVCSPTRYTLLTGRYHWRTRLQRGIVGVFEEPLIAPDRMTIASLVKPLGYTSACIGKWHLGWDWPLDKDTAAKSRALGGKAGGGGEVANSASDELRAAWRTAFAKPVAGGPTARGFDRYFGTDVPNWPPYCYIENDRTVGIPDTLLTAEWLKKDQASKQGPALEGWRLDPILETLTQRAEAFVAEQAPTGKPFLLYLPFTSPHTPIAPSAAFKGKSGLGDYGDLVLETDAAIGRVLAALDKAGVAQNTLVVMTSDNGFASYVNWSELKAAGHKPSGPLRGFKFDVYEGGHRVPFIVRWPGVVAPGTVCDQLIMQADLFATIAELTGATVPPTAGEDSFSLLPLLKGGTAPVRTLSVSTGGSGQPGFRDGAWKYIPAADADGVPQLYNLADDLAETRNLAAQEPERVKAMAAAFEKLIADGRSTPGPQQPNDVNVVRYPKPESAGGKAGKAGKAGKGAAKKADPASENDEK